MAIDIWQMVTLSPIPLTPKTYTLNPKPPNPEPLSLEPKPESSNPEFFSKLTKADALPAQKYLDQARALIKAEPSDYLKCGIGIGCRRLGFRVQG